MRFATIVLLGIVLLGALGSLEAATPAGASQVAIGFTGGAVWTSASTGICIWYFPLVGDLNMSSLFAAPLFGAPAADRDHAYFIWVSDFSVQMLPPNKGFNLLALIPTGDATIYYSNRPDLRDWSDLTNRSTWGQPVAKLTRKAGILQSVDGGASDTFTFTAELVSSTTFTLNGKSFNFQDLIPHGMTCFEAGAGGAEAGTCVAAGQ